ncbi:MAG: ABC transporter substrate-binding protein [Hominilimicola sp.]
MRRKYIALIIIICTSILSGCAGTADKTVKIAVMGNPEEFYSGYGEGIERAVQDLNNDYSDSGYNVECEFYSDNGSYEQGAAIVDSLLEDKDVTAVIGAIDMEINKTAAHVFNEEGKLFVVPYFLYDRVYSDNHYETVFSMCNSGRNVGRILRLAAAQTTAKRWAVCSADGEFERSEMNGFLKYTVNDDISVVDCTDISVAENQFDETYKKWEILDVDGIVIFPGGNDGFNILKKIKSRNPDIVCAGDTSFDDSELLNRDSELKKAMEGFIMAEEFALRDGNNEENSKLSELVKDYMIKTGNEFDTWYVQGYNAVRMVADTAIENKTCDSMKIAQLLHENGYKGLYQSFEFTEDGFLKTDIYKYHTFDKNGYVREHTLNN